MSRPQSAPRKRLAAEERREQILDSALRVFSRKNYDWATIDDIAEEAGVSPRVIYTHFEGKKELYQVLFRRIRQEFLDELMKHRPPAEDLRAFLKMIARGALFYVVEKPMEMKVLVQSVAGIDDPDLRKEIQIALRDYLGLLEQAFSQAKKDGILPPDVREDLLSSACMGLILAVTYAQMVNLKWYEENPEDALIIADYFVDMISSMGDNPA